MAGKVIEIHDSVSKDRIELTDKENKQYREILNTALELEEKHKKGADQDFGTDTEVAIQQSLDLCTGYQQLTIDQTKD